MADTPLLDNPDQQFAENVNARHDAARAAATNTKYAPIGPNFTLNAESPAAMPSDANVSASDDPTAARYSVTPSNYKYQPLAAPISLSGLNPATPAPQSGGGFLDTVGDIGKTALGAAERGFGQTARLFGKMSQYGVTTDPASVGGPEGENWFRDNPIKPGEPNPMEKPAQWLEDMGQNAMDSRTPASIMAEENSRLGGSLTDPSTWTFGKNPSVRGLLMQGADALGSMAPVLLANFMGGLPAAAIVGGAQSGGAGVEQARETIKNMDDATLAKQSKVYRKALADGDSKADARAKATQAAENWAALLTTPIGAAGGMMTGKFLSPSGRIMGESGILGQTVGKAVASGTEQAAQNVGQGMATQAGINQGAGTDLDVMKDSFANAATGFVAGAVPGAVHGAVEGAHTSKLPVADGVQPSDITFKGRPFISLGAAKAAAAAAGDGAQVMRVGNRFIVRKPPTAGEELLGGLGDQAGNGTPPPGASGASGFAVPDNANIPTAQRRAKGEDAQGESAQTNPGDFTRGQTAYVTQNGRSLMVKVLGYEQNAAAGNSPERLVRVETPDGRGHFVRAGDLTAHAAPDATGKSDTAQLAGPEPTQAIEGPPARPALPAAENVTAAGDGFIARPAFNIPANAPRGIRNNNPGNIEKGAGFQGETDGNDPRFATFSTPEQGIRGLAVNLLAYQDKHGLNTVAGIINRWAPSSENKTGAYVNAVAKALDVKPDAPIDLHDPNVLMHLTAAIIHHENGIQPYPGEMIRTGVEAAISGRQLPARLSAPTVSVDSTGQAMTAEQRTQSARDAQARRRQLDDLGLTADVAEAAKNHPATLEAAFHEAQTSPRNDLPEPTDAQKEAGNYKMGHARVGGLDISIENPEGSTRSGVDADGRPWSSTMQSHYGYIRGTVGRDGDHVDAFIKPGTTTDHNGPVYVIDQINPSTGRFDEHKTMIGYDTQAEAEKAYRANYTKDWKGMGQVTAMDMPTFKSWLDSGETKKPAAQWKGAEAAPEERGLGTIATDATKANGKGFMVRSEAEKAARGMNGNVVRQGDRFMVRDEIPGQDVHAPGRPGSESTDQVMTPAGREMNVKYRVVDADSLTASHTDTGQTNPEYPQSLQPRDRSRQASDAQIQDISANLRPAMLGASVTTTDGAPIISHRGVVESGNGRTLAIKRAYDQKSPSAKKYRQWLKDQGYDVAGIKKPVLVRQRATELSDKDLQAYTRESNARSTLQMSATEQAQADAKSMAPLVEDYRGGDIRSAANRDFVRRFVRDVAGKSEQGSLVGPDGSLSQEGARRIQAALLSHAYDSPHLVADLFESGENDIKSIGGAMLDAAGQWAQLRDAVKKGAVPKDMDITPNLVEAVNLVRKARAEGQSVHDLANQADMLSGDTKPETLEFLRTFFKNDAFTRGRGRPEIAEMLSQYADLAQSTKPGENLFGEEPPAGGDILRNVNERHAQPDAAKQQGLLEGSPDYVAGDEAHGQEIQRQGPGRVRGQPPEGGERSQVGERDDRTIDLFAPQTQGRLDVSGARGEGVDSGRRTAPRIPSFPEIGSKARAVVIDPEKGGKSAVVVESKQTDSIAVGDGAIKSHEDAARALASLRKFPQENMVALLTDKDGRPIGVLRHTVGRTNSADIMPMILAGHIARYPKAAEVWLAHNHPSGTADLSDADVRVTNHFADMTDGSKVKLRGMLAIAGGKYAFMDPVSRGNLLKDQPIQPQRRTRTIPIVERRFRRVGTLGETISPRTAPKLVSGLLEGKPGIVFLDAQLRPVATYPMSIGDMAHLKHTGNLDRITGAAERANASNAIVYVPDGSGNEAARNVGALISKAHKAGDVHMLDIISEDKSLAEKGEPLSNPSGIVESRGPADRMYRIGSMVDDVNAAARKFMKGLPGASGLDVHVVGRASDVPEKYRPSSMAEGVYYPREGAGSIYLVAENLPTLERARQVLAHEVVGHFGMEAMLGERFADVLADVQRLAPVPEGMRLKPQRPGDKYYATLDAVKMDYPDYSPENQAREVLARMAEVGVRPYFLGRVYGYIRQFLRKIGLVGQYSNAEIRNMVADAARKLRSGTAEQSRAGVLSAAESLKSGKRQLAAEVMAELQNNDNLFRYPTSKGHTLKAVMADIDPTVKYAGFEILSPEQSRDIPGNPSRRVTFKTRDGSIAQVYVNKADIWMDVSRLHEGEGGSAIYAAVADYAYNTKHKFIGDPAGLSDVALRRRTDAMLSSAIKHGTTDHLEPHPRQLAGDKKLGVPPLEWTDGKYYDNVQSLIETSVASLEHLAPSIRNGTFVPGKRAFADGEGRPLSNATLDAWLPEGAARTSSIGHSTLKRGILLRTLLRGEGGAGSELLAQVLRDVSPYVGPDSSLAGTFHSRGEHGSSEVKPESDRQAPPSEGLSSGGLESRATTAGEMPTDQKEPRYRGNVERPGENLSKVERNIRQRTMAKIGAFSEIEPIRERMAKLSNRWQEKGIQGVFDQFAPLKKLNPVAYMQARLSKGTDGAVEALFNAGSVKLTDGALDMKATNGGLLKILSGLHGEHDHWLAWIAGNRAEQLAKEGREHLFTPEDIATLKGMSRGRMADGRDRKTVYDKALKEFNELQRSVLDVAEKAGLIDGETRGLWEHEFYVPFYRVMESDQTGALGPGQIGGLVGQYAFKKLKGGEERLGDLLGNTMSNWSHLLSASMKNLAAQEAMRSAVDMGIAEPVAAGTKGSVRIMVKGHEQHYLVNDPLVLDALTALHFTGFSGPIIKAMSKFKHMLTTGVTISPTFRLRNLARDTISAIAANDLSYNPMRNLADGWAATNKGSETYKRLLAGGGAIRFGTLNDGGQAHHAKRLIESGVEDSQILNSQAKVKKAFAKTWEWYLETGDRAETVNRAAIYDQAIKAGKSHLEASYMARDLQDFTAGGSFASVRLLSQVVPFLNARLQGMYKLGRAANDDPRRFMAVTGAVALASAGLFLVNQNDPDYKQAPDWVRNNYWMVKLPGQDKFFYIPKPFEIGALGSVVERATEFAVSGKDYEAKDFANTLLALTMNQLSMNPIPQAIKPAMGAAFNYDDFRERSIDSDGQMHLPAGDRFTARTSAGAVLAGKALHVSPQRLEYLLKGYFGWLGTQALNVADMAARPFTDMPANPSRDMSKIDNWFMVGDFIKDANQHSGKYIQRYYDGQREIDQVYAAYSEARKIGDIERARELAGDDALKLRPLYQAAGKEMKRINSRIKEIDNDTGMDARAKNELRDALYLRRNRLAALVDERARAHQ